MRRSKAAVRATYDRIADSYAKTRIEPWPEVMDFIIGLPAGDLVLDVGCGHGRHARPLALTGHRVVGIDLSRRLLSIAKASAASSRELRTVDWVGGDATTLPFSEGTFDAVLSVAVVHHLPSNDDRIRGLEEMRRVLRPGGRAFISVWSHDDPQVATRLGRKPKGQDVEIPWDLPGGPAVPRFYHLFHEAELERLVAESGLHGERFFRGGGNWFALVKKDG